MTDPRLYDARVPTDGSVDSTKLAPLAVIAGKIGVGAVDTTAILDGTILVGDIAASAKDAAAGTASLRSLSTTATTACAGNDARLSDTRTPTAASITQAMFTTGYRATFTGTSAPGTPSAGDHWYDSTNNLFYLYNGTSFVCITPQSAQVATNQAIGSAAAYVDLTTTGPAVTITTGTKALVTLSCSYNSTQNPTVNVGFAVSGATTLAASDANALGPANIAALQNLTGCRVLLITGLTAGANTFTMKYKSTSSVASTSFLNRDITVVGVP